MTRWLDNLTDAAATAMAVTFLALLFAWMTLFPALGALWLLGAL